MIQKLHINEYVFLGILNLKEFASLKGLSLKREIELQGKQFLLEQMLDEKFEVIYDDKGKPHLKNSSKHFSISHSHDRLAIIINTIEATGIDIELIRDKILNIKHKFLSESELLEAGDDIEKLLIYWAAKETLYKIYGLKEVDFMTHLFVKPFIKCTLGSIIGVISMPNFNESFELNYQIMEDYVLVYSLKKSNC